MKTTLTRTASIFGMTALLLVLAGAASADPGSSSSKSRDRASASRRETGSLKQEVRRGDSHRVDPSPRHDNRPDNRYDGRHDDRYDGRHDDRGRNDHDRWDRNDHDRWDRNDHDRWDRDHHDHGQHYDGRGYYDGRGRYDGYGHYYRGDGRYYRPARRPVYFEVPRVIVIDRASYYRDYYYGQVWVPEHGHFHTIYRFPVWADYEWQYRPFAYCDGNFYATGTFGYDGPVFDFNIRFNF